MAIRSLARRSAERAASAITVSVGLFSAPATGIDHQDIRDLMKSIEAVLTTFSLCQRSFTPPLAQPPAKSYLEYSHPWPANSWVISEPSRYYQSYYVRLLAAFVR
jgi:hypothetical protein